MLWTYLVLVSVVYLVNVLPAFMPPTWMLLVFFALRQNLYTLPVIVLGAIAATLGRITLMYLAGHFGKLLPAWMQTNYKGLGELLKKRTSLTIPVVLAIAFSPIPSNQLFVVAGLSDMNKKLVAGSFLLGRMISYSFWVLSAKTVNNRLEDLFEGYLDPTKFLIAGGGIIFMIWLVGAIPWSQIRLPEKKR